MEMLSKRPGNQRLSTKPYSIVQQSPNQDTNLETQQKVKQFLANTQHSFLSNSSSIIPQQLQASTVSII